MNLLTHDKILNFIIGQDVGYTMKHYVINRFLNNGNQFVFLKRNKQDMNNKQLFFADILHEFPEHSIRTKGNTIYINNEIAGYTLPLSTWQSEKSNSYPGVTTILYDGFMKKNETSRFLKDEPRSLLNFMDTVFRDREHVTCICYDDHLDLTNPYFVYFGLHPNIYEPYTITDSIFIELESVELIENECISKVRELNYKGLFIEDRTKESKHVFSVEYEGYEYGVWIDVELVMLFISKEVSRNKKIIKHNVKSENYFNCEWLHGGWKREYELLKLVKAFKRGILRFDDEQIRGKFYKIFQLFGIW